MNELMHEWMKDFKYGTTTCASTISLFSFCVRQIDFVAHVASMNNLGFSSFKSVVHPLIVGRVKLFTVLFPLNPGSLK